MNVTSTPATLQMQPATQPKPAPHQSAAAALGMEGIQLPEPLQADTVKFSSCCK